MNGPGWLGMIPRRDFSQSSHPGVTGGMIAVFGLLVASWLGGPDVENAIGVTIAVLLGGGIGIVALRYGVREVVRTVRFRADMRAIDRDPQYTPRASNYVPAFEPVTQEITTPDPVISMPTQRVASRELVGLEPETL